MGTAFPLTWHDISGVDVQLGLIPSYALKVVLNLLSVRWFFFVATYLSDCKASQLLVLVGPDRCPPRRFRF